MKKTTITDPATIAKRERRKKELLWQWQLLKDFKKVTLVRVKEADNEIHKP